MKALVKFQYADHTYTATVHNLESLITYLQTDEKKAYTISVTQANSRDTAEQVCNAIFENMKCGQILVTNRETLPELFEGEETPGAYLTDSQGYITAPCTVEELEKLGTIGDGDGDKLFYFNGQGEQVGFEVVSD